MSETACEYAANYRNPPVHTDGLPAVTRHQPPTDEVMRMHPQTAMIENGFVHLPKEAAWLRIPARADRFPARPARRPGRFDCADARLDQGGRRRAAGLDVAIIQRAAAISGVTQPAARARYRRLPKGWVCSGNCDDGGSPSDLHEEPSRTLAATLPAAVSPAHSTAVPAA